MELFGRAKIVAGESGHREAPKARALAEGLGPPPENFGKIVALSSYLSAFEGLNLKYYSIRILTLLKTLLSVKYLGGYFDF